MQEFNGVPWKRYFQKFYKTEIKTPIWELYYKETPEKAFFYEYDNQIKHPDGEFCFKCTLVRIRTIMNKNLYSWFAHDISQINNFAVLLCFYSKPAFVSKSVTCQITALITKTFFKRFFNLFFINLTLSKLMENIFITSLF